MPWNRNRKLLKPCLFLMFVLGAGCSKKSEPPSPAASTSAAPPPAASAVASVAPPTSAVAPATPPGILAGALARESSLRPPPDPSVEKVIEAFNKTGTPMIEVKQHMAAPFLARYCVAAHTEADLYADICEYPDLAQTQKGKEESQRAFPSFKNRTFYSNRRTVLTLREVTPSPKSAEQVKTLSAAFMAL
jgi:hypothetical protein